MPQLIGKASFDKPQANAPRIAPPTIKPRFSAKHIQQKKPRKIQPITIKGKQIDEILPVFKGR